MLAMLTMMLANMVTMMLAVCSGYDIKVWLGKVFSPGHTQLLYCALKSTSECKG